MAGTRPSARAAKLGAGGSGRRRSMFHGVVACLTLAALAVTGFGTRPARAQYVGQVSSFVMDAQTGRVLQQYRPDLQRYPASLTKLMTLYVAFSMLRQNHISLDQSVPVSAHAASMEPSKLGIVPGTYMTVEQAILALVTKSANDAACALGELMGGGGGAAGEQRFAQMMTQQARLLGMRDTTFRNASGLPDPGQVSTARDFAMLAQRLIRDFPDQYHYFSVPAFVFHGRFIGNHDPMLRSYAGADGLKTGYTADAGHNLVSSAVRGDVRLIGVVLGARSNTQRSAMMTNILDAAFAAEGVPVMQMPRRPAVTLVSDSAADQRVSRRRHRARRGVRLAGARQRRPHVAGLHLAVAQVSAGRHHGGSRFGAARLRRVLAHDRRAARLRLAEAASSGSGERS